MHALNKVSCDEGVYVLIFPDTDYKYAEQFEKYFASLRGKQEGGCSALSNNILSNSQVFYSR
ncbi:MAG: hypothetical protein QN229_04150 [Desulfurococcaceae archaeon TW002]